MEPISKIPAEQTAGETLRILERYLNDARCEFYGYYLDGKESDRNLAGYLCENVMALENAIEVFKKISA